MKKYDITALGECLIDFTPAGVSPAGMLLFERNPGGAPANMLVCASNMGRRVAFIGKVGTDMQGQFLRDTIRQAGVDTSSLMMTDDYFTTLAFVTIDDRGERSFAFARKPGADTQLTADELDMELLRGTGIFHIGSLSMTNEPIRTTTVAAIEAAKKAGAMISYDPNYRPLLWNSKEAAQVQIRSLLPYVDLIKISDDECEITTGYADPKAAAQDLRAQGISCVVITLGAKGAYLSANQGECLVGGYHSETVMDTTGAGDAFWGAFLSRISESGQHVRALTLDQLRACGDFACAAASLCVEKRGGIPAMPSRERVERLCRRAV
ncbi:carbohydrate kinase family protein [Dysosmobacter sp.]